MNKSMMMLAAAMAVLPSAAMAAPDFSGTWSYDKGASDPDPYPLYWLSRPPAGAQNSGGPDAILEVKQAGGTLVAVDRNRPGRTYALDGRPHVVATDTGVQKATVTATLRDDGLTVATMQPYGGMPGNAPSTTTQTWRFSPDSKTLTISIVRNSPARQQTLKEVYTRK
jgi:hypothetical protein